MVVVSYQDRTLQSGRRRRQAGQSKMMVYGVSSLRSVLDCTVWGEACVGIVSSEQPLSLVLLQVQGKGWMGGLASGASKPRPALDPKRQCRAWESRVANQRAMTRTCTTSRSPINHACHPGLRSVRGRGGGVEVRGKASSAQ